MQDMVLALANDIVIDGEELSISFAKRFDDGKIQLCVRDNRKKPDEDIIAMVARRAAGYSYPGTFDVLSISKNCDGEIDILVEKSATENTVAENDNTERAAFTEDTLFMEDAA